MNLLNQDKGCRGWESVELTWVTHTGELKNAPWTFSRQRISLVAVRAQRTVPLSAHKQSRPSLASGVGSSGIGWLIS
jgi:hypothetical protein